MSQLLENLPTPDILILINAYAEENLPAEQIDKWIQYVFPQGRSENDVLAMYFPYAPEKEFSEDHIIGFKLYRLLQIGPSRIGKINLHRYNPGYRISHSNIFILNRMDHEVMSGELWKYAAKGLEEKMDSKICRYKRISADLWVQDENDISFIAKSIETLGPQALVHIDARTKTKESQYLLSGQELESRYPAILESVKQPLLLQTTS